MRQSLIGIALVAIIGCAAEDEPSSDALDRELAAGDATVFADDENAFTYPAPNLDRDDERTFFKGKALFRDNWVEAPASTDSRDGLGPLFNARTCDTCHEREGRGRPPEPGEEMISMFLRLSLDGGPEPTYGMQFQPLAVAGVAPEGEASIDWVEEPGQFADGEPYSLRRPMIELSNLGYGPMAEGTVITARVARRLIGLGLLAAIDDKDVLAGDGRPNRVLDPESGEMRLGRFGWKASEITVYDQAALAFLEDIGMTSTAYPAEACTTMQSGCLAAPPGGEPELEEAFLEDIAAFTSTLGVPARRDVDDEQVLRGEELFDEAGCTRCHSPTHVTGSSPDIPAFANQTIHAYTDLLLHDMGEGLADGRVEGLAGGGDWRTPPLWGIGLIETVNGHLELLHDGRARGFAEAILWHDGEGALSREAFMKMSKEERAAIVRFLESL